MSKKIEKYILSEIEILNESLTAEEMINIFQNRILELNNSYLAFWFCYLLNYQNSPINIKLYEEIVLRNKELKYNYLFARDIVGANIPLHEKVILDSKNAEYSYKFIKYIPDVKEVEHINVILESNNYDIQSKLLRDIKQMQNPDYANIEEKLEYKKFRHLMGYED